MLHSFLIYLAIFLVSFEFIVSAYATIAYSRKYSEAGAVDAVIPDLCLPEVDIIASVYNEEDCLDAFLESVLALNYPKHLLRVFIIDDCSTDRSAEIIQRFELRNFHNLEGWHFRQNESNSGLKAHSFNQHLHLLNKCRGYVLALDSDCVLPTTCLRQIVEFTISEGAQIGNGAVVATDRFLKPTNNYLDKICRTLQLGRTFNIGSAKTVQHVVGQHVTRLFGGFHLIEASLLAEVGNYSPSLTEDYCLGVKSVFKHGAKSVIANHVIVETTVQENFKSLIVQRIRWTYGLWDALALGDLPIKFERKLISEYITVILQDLKCISYLILLITFPFPTGLFLALSLIVFNGVSQTFLNFLLVKHSQLPEQSKKVDGVFRICVSAVILNLFIVTANLTGMCQRLVGYKQRWR